MTQAYEHQHNFAESMSSLSPEQLGEQQLEERKLPPGWRAYRNEDDSRVVYFNEATNTSEYNLEDLFKKLRSKTIATTNHPNNNEPRRTSASAACGQPAERHAPPRPDQSRSSSTILGVPAYVTPTKSMKLPDPKEVIDLISSGSDDDETQLEENDDKKTDLDNSRSSDRLPLTCEFENMPRSTTSGAGDDDDTSNACGAKSYDNRDDKSVCLL
jgi:hypothetical protein